MSLLNPEIQFHLQTDENSVGKYIILTGDPGRVPKIAAFLDSAEKIAYNREFCTYTGNLLGEKVSVVSTGIGGPSAAIAIEELVRCRAHTFIRTGTSGGINLKVSGGDLIIASAAVRGDGASYEYLPPEYPAVSDFDVTVALCEAAKELSENKDGKRYHVGVVQSKDSFYGEIEPQVMPIREKLLDRWESYVRLGCLTSEMEIASINSVALSRGVRAGGVLTALWNVERTKKGLPDKVCDNNDRAILCAVNAIKLLITKDRQENE